MAEEEASKKAKTEAQDSQPEDKEPQPEDTESQPEGKESQADEKEHEAQRNSENEEQSVPEQEEEVDSELQEAIDEAVAAALAEQRDTVMRAQAEVQNMRRRCEADVEKAHKFALEKFSGALLPVMDNMERAMQAVSDPQDDKVKGLFEGLELTMKEFLSILNKFDIEQIDPQGEPFDPQIHEAMSMVENPDVEPNTVITVMQKGYTLNGRVIRPAMVMVSK